MKQDNMLKIINENGQEEEIEVIHYFQLKSNGREYIVYKNKNNKNVIFTSEVSENNDEIQLKTITDEKIIQELKEITKELQNG